MKNDTLLKVNSRLELLLKARLHDPHHFLGVHRENDEYVLRVFLPNAQQVWVLIEEDWAPLTMSDSHGLFEWHGVKPPPCAISPAGRNKWRHA